MRHLILPWVFFILLSIPFPTLAKGDCLTIYSAGEGIIQKTITQIYQTSDGTMWAGTFRGLHRFDGKNWERVLPEKGNQDFPIRSMLEMRGSLFLTTENALWKVDVKTNEKRRVWFSNEVIHPILLGIKGSDAFFIEASTGRIHSIPIKGAIQELGSIGYGVNHDQMWFNEQGLWTIHKGILELRDPYRPDQVQFSSPTPGNFRIFGLDSHLFLLTGSNTPQIFHSKERKTVPAAPIFKTDRTLVISNVQEQVAIFHPNGKLLLLNVNDLSWQEFTNLDLDLSIPISPGSVNKTYLDRESNLWIGVDGLGLIRLDRDYFKLNRPDFTPLKGTFIRSACRDGRIIWIGTLGKGIFRYDPSGLKEVELPKNENISIVTDLEPLSVHQLIVSTDRGTFIFDHKENRWDKMRSLPIEASVEIFRSDTSVLFSAEYLPAVYKLRKNGTAFPWIFPEERVLQCFGGSSEEILLGTRKGLNKCRVSDGRITSIPAFKEYRVFSIHNEGNQWIVGTNRGAYLYLPPSGKLTRLPFPKYDSEPFIYDILKDDQGRYWMTSDQGLWVYSDLDQYPIHIGEGTGIQSLEFSLGASIKLLNNDLFFGGTEGVNLVDPDQWNFNETRLRPKVVGIENLGKKLPSFEPVILDYEDCMLDIHLGVGRNSKTDIIQYAYCIQNRRDSLWTILKDSRTVHVQALEPGSYHVLAKARYPGEIWGPTENLLQLRIRPPFYKTWWFLALVSIFLFGMITLVMFLFIRRREERREARRQMERALEKARLDLASSLHDDLGATLTRLALNGERMAYEHPEAEVDLRRLAHQAREATIHLKDIVWATDPEKDDFDSLSLKIRQYLGNYLENLPLQWEFRTSGVSVPDTLDPRVRQLLFRAVKELVNNILKHANAKKVSIELENHQKMIQLTVIDDGQGFVRTENSTGRGLSFLERRVKDLDGELSISHQEAGTTIVLKFFNVYE